MSRRSFRLAALAAGLATLPCACASASVGTSPAPTILPLRTLRLYETGVGYFERSGPLASSATSLPVPAGHLDDALKTLVVLTPGLRGQAASPHGATTVHGIEFGSTVSRGMARALAGLPADGEQPIDLPQLLVGLKGAAIEVRTRDTVRRGRLVDAIVASDGVSTVASKETAAGAPRTEATKESVEGPKSLTLASSGGSLLLVTDAGAIVRIAAADIESVRPLDSTWATRLGSALDALSSRGAQTERLLHVVASGGPIALGYVAEAPVWRTTYRVVLDSAGKSGVLQGWALLHNDTDETWHDVRVELANGRPDSFLSPLAAPRYTRRALVAPDAQLATVPQLLGTTADAIWGDQLGEGDGAGGAVLSGIGEGGGGYGEGIGLGGIGTLGRGAGAGSSGLLVVGILASAAPAPGAEAGALFVYSLAEPVDLRAHGSALVPFVEEAIDAAPIAWVDAPGSPARTGVRFLNSTSQTLPAGPIAFFADRGFAGESSLARLKPGERRFITYGLDLDVALDLKETRASDETKRLVWNKTGRTLEEHYLRTSDLTYAVENRSAHARSIVLAMPIDRNATLAGPDAVDFDAATSRPLAVFVVGAQKKVERAVHSVEGLLRGTPFAELTAVRAKELASAQALQATDRAAATQAAADLQAAEDDAKSATRTKGEVAEVEQDLSRLREHMKAFAGERESGASRANPFAARVLGAEDRLAALRKKLEAVEADLEARRGSAEVALAKLAR